MGGPRKMSNSSKSLNSHLTTFLRTASHAAWTFQASSPLTGSSSSVHTGQGVCFTCLNTHGRCQWLVISHPQTLCLSNSMRRETCTPRKGTFEVSACLSWCHQCVWMKDRIYVFFPAIVCSMALCKCVCVRLHEVGAERGCLDLVGS